jgi:hypothetical protein
MEPALKNNQKPSFIRLWKWYLLRLNQSSLKPKAPIVIGGGSIATWNRARLTERIKAKRSSLNQNSAPVAEHSQKLTPNADTILSQLLPSFFWYSTCDDNPQTRAYQKKDTSQHGGLRAGARQPFSVSSPAKRKKSPVSLAVIEAILEIIEKSWENTSQGLWA